MNTELHVSDTDFGMEKGLFTVGFSPAVYKRNHHPDQEDFVVLAERISIKTKRAQKKLIPFLAKQDRLDLLIRHSFLDGASKNKLYTQAENQKNFFSKE